MFEDKENKLRAVVNIGMQKLNGKLVNKSYDEIYGKIYKYDSSKFTGKDEDIIKMVDLQEQLSEIEGNIYESIHFDSKEMWNINKDIPTFLLHSLNPLPSDWRFREDLIWLSYNDFPKCEKWKLRLEEEQRRHRRLRAEHAKKK